MQTQNEIAAVFATHETNADTNIIIMVLTEKWDPQ